MPAPFDSPHLSAGWLGEPQSPLALERVLDGEVVLVVEHSHRLSVILGLGAPVLAVAGGDGDGGKVDLLVHVRCVNRSGSHCACRGCDSVSGGWLDCERVGEGRRKKEKAENLELSDAGVKIAGQRRWDVKRQQAEKLAVAARERESLDCFSFWSEFGNIGRKIRFEVLVLLSQSEFAPGKLLVSSSARGSSNTCNQFSGLKKMSFRQDAKSRACTVRFVA